MARISAIVLLFTTSLFSTGCVSEVCRGQRCFSGQDWSRPCVGAHCQLRTEATAPLRQYHLPAQTRQGQVHPSYQQDGHYSPHQAQSAPLSPYTIIQPQHGGFTQPVSTDGARRTNPRTITAEVFHPGCAGGTCPTSVSHRSSGDDGTPRDCKGIGCKLPSRMRQKHTSCVGDACGDEGRLGSSPVHVTDRAAQYLDELPDFGSERGAFIQLTCDMKPGNNEVPSEDALILQLQLSKGQERLVEALRSQQNEVKELQRLLSDQQGALVSQQREILEQQQRMFEQMEQVKAQYNILMDGIKHTSFQNLQGELDTHMDSMGGQGRPHQAQQALSLHKLDMEATVMEVGRSMSACGICNPDEFCDYSSGHPRCEKCTICPAGFFLVAQCSGHADRICQDRDECLEIADLCGDEQKCLNTPGGFRCQDMTEREAHSGMCGHGYFFNSDMDECQACTECDGQPVASPCTFTADTICAGSTAAETLGDSALSQSWAGDVSLQSAKGNTLSHAFPSAQLQVRGKNDAALVSAEDGRLTLRQHGLVWLDENLSVSHGCRSFIQVCLRVNNTDGSEGRELSGVRVEQREQRSLQSVSISGVAEVAPGHIISLSLRSANSHCNQSGDGIKLFDSAATSLSLLWLSHDTGAVAMTAQAMVSAHYHTNYRPVFRTTSTSDPYVLGLTHDGRGIRFAESGTIRFVFQQAVYSMGQACATEGFQVLAYLSQNGTGKELFRSFKSGVHYRDMSISLSGAAQVNSGDTLGFEILSPAQCTVRFFGDETGISILSLVWVPAAISSSLSASVARTGLPSGAVRNKPLFFHQTSPQVSQMGLLAKGSPDQKRDLVFKEGGTASLALDLKLIHSCNLVKVTLFRRSDGEVSVGGGTQRPVPMAQQVAGQMPEGSQWASVSLRASFKVHNSTTVFFTLDCVRGRINEISHQTGSGMSVLWVAAQ